MLIKTPQQLIDLANSIKAQASKAAKIQVLVSMGTCGIAAGATPVYEAFKSEVAKRGTSGMQVLSVGCVGLCHSEPTVEILNVETGKSTIYGNVKPEQAAAVLDGKGEEIKKSWFFPEDEKNPGDCLKARIVLRNSGRIDPESINDYFLRDG
ncbi:MAG: (2Fe-2S) ferredoxin domain-containing protein, partial [Candidatus Riflebacteria bacterium]|nr:(2Fe-2S) ferredoxin domain-containing protein [Candidatus Riflebacteria bacterium]